ncbi:hypothetical protein MTO96_000261 [Rhipicephalus appendiculatus]
MSHKRGKDQRRSQNPGTQPAEQRHGTVSPSQRKIPSTPPIPSACRDNPARMEMEKKGAKETLSDAEHICNASTSSESLKHTLTSASLPSRATSRADSLLEGRWWW